MKSIKRYLIAAVMVLAAGSLSAQDLHFSQFYNAPLMLNPALTGKINGSFRVGINYRNQWFGQVNGRTTFSTPAVSFDMPIRLNNGDAVGVGGYIANDRSSGGLFTRLQFMATGAYHKALGSSKNHSLSFGLQFGYLQRRLDVQNILFESQLGSDNALDPSINSGENIDDNTNNVDANIGIAWGSRFSKKFFMYGGFSIFNIIEPFNTFTTNTNGDASDDFMRRFNVNVGASIRVATKVSLMPSVIYQQQAKAMETNLGLSAGIDFTSDVTLFLGAYYRINDAFIPYVGLDFKNFRLGLSHDFNASSLEEIDGGHNGSFELSLSYIGKYIPVPDVDPALYCPRF